MVPALVTAVGEESVDVLVKGGEAVNLTKENGITVRRYLSENRRTAPVEDPRELLSPGDIIRLQRRDDTWTLTQVPAAQAALVSLDPDTGAIRALVGGFDFDLSHFNRITQAERQPGSNFKPFIYTRALESGMTPATIVNDAPVVFNDSYLEKAWRPENDSGKFYGPTRLRKALYLSRNLVSIRILRDMGVDRAIRGMGRFGFDEGNLPRNLSLALGTHATTPLSIATGYATFANGGYKVDSYLVAGINDSDHAAVYRANPTIVCRDCDLDLGRGGKDPLLVEPDSRRSEAANIGELFARAEAAQTGTENGTGNGAGAPANQGPPLPELAEQVLDPRIAYIMDSMLKDVIKKGTGRKARALERNDIGGKTGTTNGPRDAWFSGYSPHLTTTVWVGFDDNSPLGRGEYGGSAALPIWIDFMAAALAGKPEVIRPQPSGITTARIDPETGSRVGPGNPSGIFELFLKENVPPPATGSDGNGESSPSLPEELF